MKLAPTFTKINQNVYDSLYVSLLDGLGTLQLLIAVCENDRLRFDIIERYEQALKEEARGFRVTLDPAEPSLRQSLQTLTDRENLAASKSHFVTVLGAERLDEASLNKFWGYLQWTREGLRALACPIVLWIPQQVLREMVKKAPDFWRWRNGVFVFTSPDLPDWEEKPLPLRETVSGRQSGLFSPEQLEDSLQRGLIAWGEESPKLIPIYAQLGDAYVQKILRNQGAETDAEWAEFLLKKVITHDMVPLEFLVRSLNALGLLYQYQGKYEKAQPLLVKALEIERQSFISDHYSLATTLNNLAGLYRAQAKTSQAESLYLEALTLIRQEAPENLATLSIALNNLAGLYRRQKRYSEAEALYREALAIDRQSLPLNHRQLASHLNNLAELYRAQKRYSEAEPLYLEALAIDRQVLPKNSPSLAIDLNNLALLYTAQERYNEAERLHLEALEINQKALPLNNLDLAVNLHNLGLLYQHQEKYEEAELRYRQALAIFDQSLGADDPQTQSARAAYEDLLREKNNA